MDTNPHPSSQQRIDALEALVKSLIDRVEALEAAEHARQASLAELEALQQQHVDEAFRVLDSVAQTPNLYQGGGF